MDEVAKESWWRVPGAGALIFLVLVECGGRTNGDRSAADGDASDDAMAFIGTIPAPGASAGGDDAWQPAPRGEAASTSLEDGAVDPSSFAPTPPFDAGPDGICMAPIAPGDLVIEELMIESVSGTGDHGEWIEVESTLDCTADIKGLHGDCPRGGKVATFDIGTDLWIPARGTFLVADSKDPAINHDLAGTLVAWLGQPGDVLRNKGTTVTLRLSGTIIDSITYPALPVTIGASLAFPAGCDLAQRSDWTRWQASTSSWFPGFLGTPNAPNTDVSCP
jgi:hypothetical protein